MFQRFTEVVGPDAATALMKHLPPTGWGDVVTREYLDMAIRTQDARIDARFAQMDTRFEQLVSSIDRRFTKVDSRADMFDERFSRIDERFTGIDRRFDSVDSRLDKVDDRLDKVDDRLDKVDSRLDTLDGRFDTLDGRFAQTERRRDEQFASIRTEIASAKHETLAVLRGEMADRIAMQTRTMIFTMISSLVTLGTIAFALGRFT